MSVKFESFLDVVAALFVLLTAMIEPRLSAGLAVLFLVAIGLYKFSQSGGQTTS